jgi:AraC-like DNA-binding protein
MGMLHDPVPTDHADWMFQVMSSCQRYVCSVSLEEQSWDSPTRAFLQSLPRVTTPAQDFLLRAALSRLAISFAFRRRSGVAGRPDEGFLAAVRILVDHSRPADRAFLSWVRLAHRSRRTDGTVGRLARILRTPHEQRVRLRAIADELGRSEHGLRLAFQRAYGMTPAEFRRRYQVVTALQLLRRRDLKVEAVAREVGFRSPKNLYRLLREATGRTPQQIQRLDRPAFDALRRDLHVRRRREPSE